MTVSTKLPCRHGCEGKDASRYPIVCMVALGSKRGSHSPLEMIMPIPVCRECQAETKAQDFLLPEGRAKITKAMRALGRADPDFDNAWLQWGRIGDQKWVEAHQQLAAGQTLQ